MTNDNDLFADAAQQVLADQCTPKVVRAIEAGTPGSAQSLWEQLEAAGLVDALVPESEGGSQLGLGQVFGVLEQCGAHALPLLLGETMIARAVLPPSVRPSGALALGRGQREADGAVRCALVRSAKVAEHVLVQVDGTMWLLLPIAAAQSSDHALALDATLVWPAAQVTTAAQLDMEIGVDLWTLQACVVAAQMAGALGTVLASTLQYANDRKQFGRPIGKFQSIQHQLAVMSEHVCAARMAAQLGCSGTGAVPDRLRVATAKARCSQAALVVSEMAHAIHGAIGFTEEFDLQLYTRRLHAWRQTAGSEAYWHDVAGHALMAQEGGSLDVIRRITDVAV